MTIEYEIRALLPEDEEELLELARHLDSVNLPHDKSRIREVVDLSMRSFTGEVTDFREREFVFVLRDLTKQRIIGTSMIVAQLGRKGAPYIYFDVLDEEKYSETIDKHFLHTVLRIGYSYKGPTEIGGLVLDPTYRSSPARLGTMISYVRFLYMAAHRELFQEEVLAELLPPLEDDGTSHLWEALGRKFTDLSYAEADVLSKRNKEFIKGLFPEGIVYASVLPLEAQGVIGRTGAQTRGVEKLLRRIGFRYAHRVDPFDGGPHFTARMDEITLVRRTKVSFARKATPTERGDLVALVAVEQPAAPFFRATLARVRSAEGGSYWDVSADAYEHLGLSEAQRIVLLPLE